MNYFIQLLVAMLATLSFSLLFSAPKKELFHCGLIGGLSWLVYIIITANGHNIILANLVSAFLLTVLARFFAVRRQKPATVYLLSGIFPLVPGAGIYYTAYYLFTSQNELSSAKGVETLEIAIAIVFGIIFGSAIPQKIFQKRH